MWDAAHSDAASDRVESLERLAILDTEPELAFDEIVQLAARACDAPVALVSLIDRHRQWFKARVGMGRRETPIEMSFCAHGLSHPGLLVVADATSDSRFHDNPLVTGDEHIRFYAGARIEDPDGVPLGMLCVMDRAPRPEGLQPAQANVLLALAGSVTRELKLRDAYRQLAERARDLDQSVQRYRALVVASGATVWRSAPAGQTVERIRPEPGADAGPLGSGWIDAVHPDDRAAALAIWDRVARSPQVFERIERKLAPDGSYRWSRVRGVPLFETGGELREWVGTVTDVHEQKLAADSLRRSEERYRALVQASATVFWTASPDGTVTDAFGWGVRDDSGTAIRMVGAMQDISYRKLVEEALRSSQDHLRKVLQALPAAVYTTDAEGRLTYFNEAATALWGREPSLGDTRWCGALRLYTPDGLDLPLEESAMAVAIREGRSIRSVEEVAERPDGSRVPFVSFPTLLYDAAGRLTGAINMLVDVTEQKAAEQKMWIAAHQDPLTGLPNRALFQQRLNESLSRARQDGTSISLLLIDLDEFKDVNDTLGHDAGDRLLQEIAGRLKAVMRGHRDTVARIGGDEFAVIVTAPFTLERAGRLAQELVEKLREPFLHDQYRLSSKVSIGVAAYPDHHHEPHELMKDADIALYRAKAQGRNQAAIYSPELREPIELRVSITRDLQRALAADEILPYYQPKVCLRTGRIIGLEALARWRHPSQGILTAGYFVSAFEDAQIAATIGRCIVRNAARDMRDWLDRGIDFGTVAVNLSSAEFLDRGLADRLLRVLADAGVPPARLEVEVTETVLLGKSSEHVTVALKQLHGYGLRIALDDFGTGFASLTHLKQFPVDHIKIDQSFIRNLEADEDDRAIVAAVVGLGRSLHLDVTAEGVETRGQAERLGEMGCSSGQGFFFAKPIAGSRVPWLFETWSSETFRTAPSATPRVGASPRRPRPS